MRSPDNACAAAAWAAGSPADDFLNSPKYQASRPSAPARAPCSRRAEWRLLARSVAAPPGCCCVSQVRSAVASRGVLLCAARRGASRTRPSRCGSSCATTASRGSRAAPSWRARQTGEDRRDRGQAHPRSASCRSSGGPAAAGEQRPQSAAGAMRLLSAAAWRRLPRASHAPADVPRLADWRALCSRLPPCAARQHAHQQRLLQCHRRRCAARRKPAPQLRLRLSAHHHRSRRPADATGACAPAAQGSCGWTP